MDDDEDFEYEEPRAPLNKSKHRWILLAALLEVFVDVFMAFHKLFAVARDSALQNYRFDNEREKFIVEASREIEMLTLGELNAPTSKTGPSFGAWPDEPAD